MADDKPITFARSDDTKPWWHSEHVVPFRNKLRDLPTPELRGINEEIKGAIISVQGQIDTEGPELVAVRKLAQEMGPTALDADKFAAALVGKFGIDLEEADGLINDLDWWKSARRFLSYTQEKRSLVTAEIARRRASDAEQAVFDIKNKIRKTVFLLENTKYTEAYELLCSVAKRLESVGP